MRRRAGKTSLHLLYILIAHPTEIAAGTSILAFSFRRPRLTTNSAPIQSSSKIRFPCKGGLSFQAASGGFMSCKLALLGAFVPAFRPLLSSFGLPPGSSPSSKLKRSCCVIPKKQPSMAPSGSLGMRDKGPNKVR